MASSKKADPSDGASSTLMLAYLCIKDIDGLNDRVSILDRFGLADSEIAAVCGVAEQSVRNARQKYKKQSSNATKSKEKRTAKDDK